MGDPPIDERARALAEALVRAGTAPTDAAASARAAEERDADAEAVARAYLARRQQQGRDLPDLAAVGAHLQALGRPCAVGADGAAFSVALASGRCVVAVTWVGTELRWRARLAVPAGVTPGQVLALDRGLGQPVWRVDGGEAELRLAVDLGHAGAVSTTTVERIAAQAHAQLVAFDALRPPPGA
jgi:hypothetical protein